VKPFTFSAAVQGIYDGPTLAETARRAEATGWTSIAIPDHLIPQLSPVPAMTAVAAATSTLRVTPYVLNNDLHHPAVLAQDLASIDVLSGGRLNIAIGAGWNKPEYDAVGLAFESQPVRLARLREAVAVLKGCFADGPFTYAGEHYTITDYDAEPKPVQRPHPPLMIGGGGRATLSFAAGQADIVGLAPRTLGGGRGSDPQSLTWEATAEKIRWVRDAAGDRFDDLTLDIYPSGWPSVVTDDPRAEAARFAERLAGRTEVDLTVDDLLGSPHVYIGTVDSLVEKLQRLRAELGISSFMLGDLDEFAPVVARLSGT
jgi:probable F420-dependent oxidoreductase